jgi:hypothetical protein
MQADGMPSETPASPPALSQREGVKTGQDEVKASSCRLTMPQQLDTTCNH